LADDWADVPTKAADSEWEDVPAKPVPNPRTGEGMQEYAANQAKEEMVRHGRERMPLAPGEQDAGIAAGMERERAKGNLPLSDFDTASLGLGGMGIGKTIATKGLRGAAAPLIKATLGAVGGSAAGGYGGRELGRIVGHPEEGAQIGATVGGLAGGFFGGMRGEPTPEKGPFVPVSESPGTYRGPSQVAQADRVAARAAATERAPVPVAQSPGPYRGPSSLPPNVQSIAEGPTAPLHSAIRSGQAQVNRLGARSLVPVSESPVPKPEPSSTGSIITLGGGKEGGLKSPTMTGSEGRAATWTNEKVMAEAAKGNRWAIEQVNRRGLEPPPNSRYIMGDPDLFRAPFNPKETTRFTPEGTPIRDMAPPVKSSRARIELTGPSEQAPSTQPAGDIPQGSPTLFGTENRKVSGQSPTGTERRQSLIDYQQAIQSTPPGQPTPGEKLSQDIREAQAGAPTGANEGKAREFIGRDPALYEKFRDLDAKANAGDRTAQKARDAMLVKAQRDMEGMFGTKVKR